MSHNHLHLAALALRKTKTHLILAYYWIRQRIEATPTLKFSPGICFNTQPWFSTLHWGTADGFNAGKVGLQHFTLLPHCPAIDTQHINLQDLHDKTSILRKEGVVIGFEFMYRIITTGPCWRNSSRRLQDASRHNGAQYIKAQVRTLRATV